MTAVNAPLTVHADQRAFRRGVLAGIVASLVLAMTLTVGALAAGLMADMPAAPVEQAPAQVVPAPGVAPQAPIDEQRPLHREPAWLY